MSANPAPAHLFSGAAWRLKKQIGSNPAASAVSIELDWIERRKLRNYDPVDEKDVVNIMRMLTFDRTTPMQAFVDCKFSKWSGKPRYSRIRITNGSIL